MESIRPPTRDIKISNIFKNTSLSVATKPPVNKRTTTQLAIVKWLNKRRAVGNLGSTAHSNRSSSALSTLVATAPTFLTDASMHKVPTKGLLNSYRHCNQPLQKSPGSKICSFQEVFVGDSCQQPKVVLHRSELCLCYLRALANPQAASFTELNILHLRTTSSRASGQIGSSIVWTTITSMWHAFHQPWTHWLALQSHAKLVNIQVTRQGLSFTGAIQHHNWLSSNGSTNVEQLVLTTLAPQQVSSARCGHRIYLSKAGIWQQLPQ